MTVANPAPRVSELQAADAPALMALLRAASEEYLRYTPRIRDDLAAFVQQLQNRQADRWWGLYQDAELVGYFMLRGFDEGYTRPSFGVFISEAAAGRGLAKRALAHALEWCGAHQIGAVMLKVHHGNARARQVYARAGFQPQGVCPESGQQLMEKLLIRP